jgi:CRISPR-associated endonuclease Csn1
MKKVLGLDIGIASVGWAAVEIDDEKLLQVDPETGEILRGRILGLGVRTFTQAENPKDGKSLALPRREKRSARKRLRRRRYRLEKIKQLFIDNNILSLDQIKSILEPQAYEKNSWQLRAHGLERKLENNELLRTLYHIAKLRGYKPQKTELEDDKKKSEDGKVKTAIRDNSHKLEQEGLLTFPQLLTRWNSNDKPYRNKTDSYTNSIPRNLVENEARLILERQSSFGLTFINKAFINKFIEIAFSQESAMDRKQMEKMIGECTFEKKELRAPKSSYSSELFTLLTKIANLSLRTIDNPEKIELTLDQKNKIKNLALSKQNITYKAIRKELDLDDNVVFKGLNYSNIRDKNGKSKDSESDKFIELKGYHSIKKIYDDFGNEEFNSLKNDVKKFDKICEILTTTKTEEESLKELKEIVKTEIAEKLNNISFSKYIHISLKALHKINPYLEQGNGYAKACELAGYKHYDVSSENFKFDYLPSFEELQKKEINFARIKNPVVHRAVCQVRKVVNAIIREYGRPDQINIEFTRDAKNSKKQRDKILKGQKQFQEQKDLANKECLNLGLNPDEGANALRLRLWRQQNEKCIYSGKDIKIEHLKDYSSLDIDHIIPYSRSLDDSLNNKVLCFASENRQKGNKIPVEYFGLDSAEWQVFKNRVINSQLPMPKKNRLLKEKYENSDDFIERNLRDTSYAVKYTADYIKSFLRLNDNDKIKNKVQTRNGSLTAFLRHNWGFDKVRSAGDKHHAVDALVCAVSTQGMVQHLSNFTKRKEEKGREWLKKFANNSQAPTPWGDKESFRNEVQFYLDKIFVSRAPRRKASGEIHQETIRSSKKLDTKGVSGIRTKLTSLKAKNGNELQNIIFDDDRSSNSVYQVLKERLEEYNWDSEKAFANEIRMRRKDGTDGPIIKSVRTKDTQKSGLKVRNGIANNGDMLRVDVFSKTEKGKKKFYLVPVYLKDFASGVLLNKNNEESNTELLKFCFCLHKDELFSYQEKDNSKEIFCYYRGFDIDSNRISFDLHDSSNKDTTGKRKNLRFSPRSVFSFKKYTVDVLGKYNEVKSEKRMPLTK